MEDDSGLLSRYSVGHARTGTWNVHQVPGLQLTKRPGGWQMVVSSCHPDLSDRAGRRGEQINQASKLLIHSGMLHRYFKTRQEGLQALSAAMEQ